MKPFILSSVLVLLALLAVPANSDAFSRRTHTSEVGPMQATTAPVGSSTNGSAQSVPEPPVLMLMSVGAGVLAVGYAMRRLRKHA
jgi:hypothetical protein